MQRSRREFFVCAHSSRASLPVPEGYLDVKYKLQMNKDAEVMRTNVRNLANGQLHRVSIRRLSEAVAVQVTSHP